MKFAKGIVVVSAIALAGTMAAATLAYAANLRRRQKARTQGRSEGYERGACGTVEEVRRLVRDQGLASGDSELRREQRGRRESSCADVEGRWQDKEKLLDEQPNFYRYEMLESPLPVKNYQGQFALTPDDDDEDEINFAWSAVFDANGKPDKEARDMIDGIFKAGLDNIKVMAATK